MLANPSVKYSRVMVESKMLRWTSLAAQEKRSCYTQSVHMLHKKYKAKGFA
jgi:hypothetical protein